MKWFFLLFFFLCQPVLAIEEAIPLSVGLDDDYPLESSFEGKELKFDGTYGKKTGLFYDRKRNVLRFTPKRKGVGSLIIKEGNTILKKYTVSVRETDLTRVAHEIQSLLGEINGITISIINNKVIVDGEIFVPRDMKRIYNVIKQYPKQAASLVTLSASAQNKVAQFIEREIGNPNITVKAANEKFILRGTVSSKDEKANAFVIAQLYAPGVVTDKAVTQGVVRERNVKDVIINLIQVQLPPKPEARQNKLIQMAVHYVELDKDYADQFRFQWAPRIGNTEFTINNSNRNDGGWKALISGTISNLIPKLNWAKQFGFARVLHSSNIIVEEGQKGVVEATTTIPYGSLSGPDGTAQTQTASIGVALNIRPTVVGVRQDGVRLNVDFKVNNFIGMASSGPITSNRTINTYVYVRSGLSAAIGGVVSHTNIQDFNREPAGAFQSQGDPIINLLASKNFSRKKNQFVVFVTPVIKSSASTDVEQIKRKFRISE